MLPELTSPQLMWAARGVLVMVTLWVVWRWGHSGRHCVYAVLRRFVSLVGVSALVVLNLVLPLNAHYVWYSSWQDMWNAMTGEIPVVAPDTFAGAAAEASFAHPVPVPTSNQDTELPISVTLPEKKLDPHVEGRTVRHFEVAGPASDHTGHVRVLLPDGYEDNPTRQYPVIVGLHGAPGEWQSMVTILHIDTWLTRRVAAGTISEAIIVLPTWTVNGVDTECVNGEENGPNIEDWLVVDLPAWVRHQFRVIDTRGAWATLGVSAGGYCALMTAVKHPATFGSAVVLAGYTTPLFEDGYRPFGPGDPEAAQYDLTALVANNPPPVAVWMLAPKPDPLAARPTDEFAAAARPPLSVTVTRPDDGGHRMDAWAPYVAEALHWLGHNSPNFAPAPQ